MITLNERLDNQINEKYDTIINFTKYPKSTQKININMTGRNDAYYRTGKNFTNIRSFLGKNYLDKKILLPLIEFYFDQMNDIEKWDKTMYIRMVIPNYTYRIIENEKKRKNKLSKSKLYKSIYDSINIVYKYSVLTIRLSTHDTTDITVDNTTYRTDILEEIKAFEEAYFGKKSQATLDSIQFIENSEKVITFDTTEYTKLFYSDKYRFTDDKTGNFIHNNNDFYDYNGKQYYTLYYKFLTKNKGTIIHTLSEDNFNPVLSKTTPEKLIEHYEKHKSNSEDSHRHWNFGVSNSIYDNFIKGIEKSLESNVYSNYLFLKENKHNNSSNLNTIGIHCSFR